MNDLQALRTWLQPSGRLEAPDLRPEATRVVQSVEHPTFAQPLPRQHPSKSEQTTKARVQSQNARAETPMPPTSMSLSVLAMKRRESVGTKWKNWASITAENPATNSMIASDHLSLQTEVHLLVFLDYAFLRNIPGTWRRT